MTEGIDVSRYQASTPSLAGLSFLFAKATEGTTRDADYAMHIANARKAGLVTGAYHFNYGPGSISAQVAAFLAAAGDVDFYFVDVEGGNAFTHAQTAAFIAGVQAAGKKCGLYHSESGFFDAGQDWNWVANWSHAPAVHWDFWQYRGSPLDLDRFNGTPDQLRALTTTEKAMPTLATYTPGYTITVKPTANVRFDAKLTAAIRRTVSTAETWAITGSVKGEVDPAGGSDVWYVRWYAGTWEFTAKSNVTAGPTAPVTDCSPAVTAAVTAATLPLNAKIADLTVKLTAAKGTDYETARAAAIKGAGDAIDALPR